MCEYLTFAYLNKFLLCLRTFQFYINAPYMWRLCMWINFVLINYKVFEVTAILNAFSINIITTVIFSCIKYYGTPYRPGALCGITDYSGQLTCAVHCIVRNALMITVIERQQQLLFICQISVWNPGQFYSSVSFCRFVNNTDANRNVGCGSCFHFL